MRSTRCYVALALILLPGIALSATDKFRVTAAEKAACGEDAARLCISAYPDEDKLLRCMKQNRTSLTPACLVAFDAGVRRRRL